MPANTIKLDIAELTPETIMSLYLWGTKIPPIGYEKVSSDNYNVNQNGKKEKLVVELNGVDFMTSIFGRYVSPSDFSVVGAVMETEVTRSDLIFRDIVVGESYSLDEFFFKFGLNKADYQTEKGNYQHSLVHIYNRDPAFETVDEADDRAFIFNNQSFRLVDKNITWKVEEVQGQLEIVMDGLKILPFNENFDFEGGDPTSTFFNLLTRPIFDPDNIGTTIKFKFDNTNSSILEQQDYTKSDYLTDLEYSNFLTLGATIGDIPARVDRLHNDLISAGTYDYVGSTEDVVYGTLKNDRGLLKTLAAKDDDKSVLILAGAGDDKLIGSSKSDHLYGHEGEDKLFGKDGDDFVVGGSGNDKLKGGKGNDILSGDNSYQLNSNQPDPTYNQEPDAQLIAGDDFIYGGGGDDFLIGGGGADYMDGGNGVDAAFYYNAEGGITLTFDELGVGTGTGSDSEGDTLINIEQIVGSSHDDSVFNFIGVDGNVSDYNTSEAFDLISETFWGGDGNDQFSLSEGRASFVGGIGDDTLIIANNQNSDRLSVVDFWGEVGSDKIAIEADSNGAIVYSYDSEASDQIELNGIEFSFAQSVAMSYESANEMLYVNFVAPSAGWYVSEEDDGTDPYGNSATVTTYRYVTDAEWEYQLWQVLNQGNPNRDEQDPGYPDVGGRFGGIRIDLYDVEGEPDLVNVYFSQNDTLIQIQDYQNGDFGLTLA